MRNKSTGSGAFDLLLSAIDDGTLPAGTRLREVELADRFRISRTPVREALKRLETMGLVMHEPHHGAVVASLDHGQMVELYHMREVLEGTAARLAATHATPTEVEVLREMVGKDRALLAAQAGAPERGARMLAASNRVFHRQIHRAARNRFLDRMLENMRLSLALLHGTTLGMDSRGTLSLDEHADIIAAIAAHDGDAAEEAARQHIRNAFKARLLLGDGDAG